ncbi:MAG TPA: hypothetical protein VFR18_18390 [Terriglobia bacterium]|nr:hypothetical protein [Terriglobia bacterium]
MNSKLKVVLVVAGVAVLLGYLGYLTMSTSQVSCEVCVEFRGATECRRATGGDRLQAETAAASTACGLLSGGVTDGIACRNTPPKSVTCESR